MSRKNALAVLLGIVMVLLICQPVMAASATVDVYREVGTIDIITSDYLDKDFAISGTYKYRVQKVNNGKKTLYKVFDRGHAQAVDLATGVVYKTDYKYSEMAVNDRFTTYDRMIFVGPGPNNNLFMTFKYVYDNGTLIRTIDSIEIR